MRTQINPRRGQLVVGHVIVDWTELCVCMLANWHMCYGSVSMLVL